MLISIVYNCKERNSYDNHRDNMLAKKLFVDPVCIWEMIFSFIY